MGAKAEKVPDSENSFLQCSFCPGKKFKSKRGFIRHKNWHEKMNAGPKKLKCFICDIYLENEATYILHTEMLHEGKNRESEVCNDCGKQFKSRAQLIVHQTSNCGTIRSFKCDECDKYLMTRAALYCHKLRHANKKSFICTFCAKSFYTTGQLTVHERIHTKEKAFVCEICNKGFVHRQSLITHSTLHTGIKPFQCEGCGNSFSCIGNLSKHRKTHADTCGKIPFTSHRMENIQTRLKLYANTPANVKLKEKEKKEKIISLLKNKSEIEYHHVPHVEINPVADINGSRANNEKFQISNCDENFGTHTNIENTDTKVELNEIVYMKIEPVFSNSSNFENTEDIKSEYDDFYTDTKPDLDQIEEYMEDRDIKIEVNNESNEESQSEDIEKKDIKLEEWMLPNSSDNIVNTKNDWNENSSDISDYSVNLYERLSKNKRKRKRKRNVKFKETVKCKYCDKMYNKARWLRHHEQWHEKYEKRVKFQCSCCNQTFKSKEDRFKHQELSHRDILVCQICNKLFSNPIGRKLHQRYMHLGVQRRTYKYICDKCGKSHNTRVMLQHHEQTACSEIKLFKCEKCDKTFSTCYTLRTHSKVHDEPKRHVCKYCGKKFFWKGQLQIHERSHTGEKPFECQFCPKSFAYRESLITHNSIHTGIKPHICLNCGSRFSCIGNLIKHKRTHPTTCGKMNSIAEDNKTVPIINHFPNGNHANMHGVYSKRKRKVDGLEK